MEIRPRSRHFCEFAAEILTILRIQLEVANGQFLGEPILFQDGYETIIPLVVFDPLFEPTVLIHDNTTC